jgi:hypothetical protein
VNSLEFESSVGKNYVRQVRNDVRQPSAIATGNERRMKVNFTKARGKDVHHLFLRNALACNVRREREEREN